jgi:hypothetical protein
MDPDEFAICEYLKPWPGEYVAAQQICRQADGRRRFEADPKWAYAALARLVQDGALETDGAGRYRLQSGPDKKAPQVGRWLSPHIKQILEKRGKLPESGAGP